MGIGIEVVGKEPELSEVASTGDIVRDQLINLLLSQFDLGGQVDAVFYIRGFVIWRRLGPIGPCPLPSASI